MADEDGPCIGCEQGPSTFGDGYCRDCWYGPDGFSPAEFKLMAEEIGALCDRVADGGSIPPVEWRRLANKLQRLARETEAAEQEALAAASRDSQQTKEDA